LAAEWSGRLEMKSSDMNRLMSELHESSQRRVALQSVLLARPRAAVFLQPGSHLDEPTAGEVRRTMEELAHKGTAVLKIVHQF
jgi:energy-coupling factor transporter ATP-binding protein EcfA2